MYGQVIHYRPQTILINRTGCSLFLQQVGADFVEMFQPTDPPKVLQWQPSVKSELLKVLICLKGDLFAFCSFLLLLFDNEIISCYISAVAFK